MACGIWHCSQPVRHVATLPLITCSSNQFQAPFMPPRGRHKSNGRFARFDISRLNYYRCHRAQSGVERSDACCKLQVVNQPHQSRFADDDDNAPVAMLLRRVANHIQQQVAKQICQSFDHLRCRMLHVVGRRLCLSPVCCLSSVAGLPRLGSLDFCNCSAVCACASRLVSSLANLAARLRLIRGSLQQQRQQPEPELEQQHGQQTLQHFQFLGSARHAHAQLTYHVEAIKGRSITISE